MPRLTFRLPLVCLSLGLGLGAACLPTRPEGELRRVTDEPGGGGSGGGVVVLPDGGPDPSMPDGSTVDPHGLNGVDPQHGRFSGGVRVVVLGSGFAKKPRVWFGDTEAAADDVVAISDKKLQVVTPPGKPGPVEVRVQNGDDASTKRSLPEAFIYDSFYADPDNGPTSGGTIVKLHGSGTTWSTGTSVKIGDKACESVQVLAPTELTCVAAAAAPGSRSATVIDTAGSATTVLDAYAYADSDNGFKGGLSGSPLPPHPAPGQPAAGKLRVLAFDSYTASPLVGSKVYVGTEVRGTIGPQGLAEIDGVVEPEAPGPDGAPRPARVTVTVARKCVQPQSFVGVPVDTVTMYLDPVLSPDCAPPEGDPPPTGGKPGVGTSIGGEVRFPSDVELKSGPWSSVPKPAAPGERRVVYLFNATSDPKAPFRLPDASQAIAEDPDAPPTSGYSFSISSGLVGNLTLYALAGIENRTVTPPTFTAYAFGLVKGVSTKPGETTGDVTLLINSTLDQSVTLVPSPPVPSAKGPDRLQASVALSLGHAGYAIFPNTQRTVPLPLDGPMTFVGLPPLSGPLAGMRYVAAATAGTGAQLFLPIAVAGSVAFADTSKPLPIDLFVRMPSLLAPGGGPWDGVSYRVDTTAKGMPPELYTFDVESGGGLVDWFIAAPGDIAEFTLPDLRKLPKAGLIPGPVTITVSSAVFDQFSYDQLRYRHLSRSGWLSYSQDAFFTQLPP